MKNVKINTSHYKTVNGSRPHGNGVWYFAPSEDSFNEFSFVGSYEDAKKAARAHFSGKAGEVDLLPGA